MLLLNRIRIKKSIKMFVYNLLMYMLFDDILVYK